VFVVGQDAELHGVVDGGLGGGLSGGVHGYVIY